MSSAAIHHRQRGLTLLEMLVAMTIMALSITVIYRAIAGSARGVEQVSLNQRAVWLMQSLLDANAGIDPRQLGQSGQDNALSWTLSAYPHTSSAQATAANRLVLYAVDIHVQSHQGRQWQLQTLRPLLQLDGAKSQ